jgi:hypothetical protein
MGLICNAQPRREIGIDRLPERCSFWRELYGSEIGDLVDSVRRVTVCIMRRRVQLPTQALGETQTIIDLPLVLHEERSVRVHSFHVDRLFVHVDAVV